MAAPDLPPIDERLHDAIDLGSGAVETTAVRRSLTPAARAKALAKVGIRVRPPVFGAPTHRLTARAPYQASPEAWLDAADSFVRQLGAHRLRLPLRHARGRHHRPRPRPAGVSCRSGETSSRSPEGPQGSPAVTRPVS